MQPIKLYSKQYDSFCTWNGIAYKNDGKVPGAYFYELEKAKNNGFEPIFTAEEVHELFQKLVVRGCFKTDRDYEVAKETLLEMTGIDYESEIK